MSQPATGAASGTMVRPAGGPPVAKMEAVGLADVERPRARPRRRRTRLIDVFFVGVVVGSALVYFFMSTHGTWNPLYERPEYSGRFFLAQARSMVEGHLWVNRSQLPGECFVHAGRCYGYFGLTPSLVRLPFLLLLDAVNKALTPVFITAALTLATGSMVGLLRRLLAHLRARAGTTVFVALAAVALGPASVLAVLTRPAVYEEAIAWSVGFVALGAYCFVRWWETPRRLWLVLLVASLVLAANSRPTALPFAVVIGLGVAYRLWRLRATEPVSWTRLAVVGGLVAGLPIVTSVGVFLLKFGQVDPSYLLHQQVGGPYPAPWWVKIRHLDHDHFQSLRFVPTTLLAYGRPDTVHFTSTFPWVAYRFPGSVAGTARITYVGGLRPGSLYVDSVSSITAAMPLAFVSAAAALVVGLRARLGSARRAGRAWSVSWQPIVVVAAVASWALVLTSVGVLNRYLGDAYPMLALAEVVSVAYLATRWDRAGQVLRGCVAALVLVGVGWQLLVNLGLVYRTWW